MDIFHAIILGIVEGLTEFLPVSSTGHLILVSELLGIKQDVFHKTFEISIQLGSILAVLALFRERLFSGIDIWLKLAVAFIPTGALGFLLYKHVKALFAPSTVAYALILGGIVFLVLEWLHKGKEYKINSVESIGYKEALAIGFFQALAMIPGTSRSGSTIVGGLILGLNRKVAAEFSFLLALPTMFIATGYDLYKNSHTLSFENLSALGVGFVVAFIFAMIAVKGFLKFISRFNFVPFGIYRIILGIIFLFYLDLI
ncbi:MAG: undecaprenyl-diphosphate phosphatase [Wolinella succinogenes]|uniref:undecaprenyl-diphosphate phosphatase n=1 Tax=Wolinella succinogenes TaxID=844 RepID=UPI001691EB92|nr:undecaprenyl-diphosphate phosphatase [Wolinella succinogenes]NLU34467.1 undecaprenyl-diphosphate phosphatase [Wolinella succinogenes]